MPPHTLHKSDTGCTSCANVSPRLHMQTRGWHFRYLLPRSVFTPIKTGWSSARLLFTFPAGRLLDERKCRLHRLPLLWSSVSHAVDIGCIRCKGVSKKIFFTWIKKTGLHVASNLFSFFVSFNYFFPLFSMFLSFEGEVWRFLIILIWILLFEGWVVRWSWWRQKAHTNLTL